MRYRILMQILCILTLSASAQPRDSLLLQMNSIKADTEHYLYGLCTLPDEADPAVSREEARTDLLEQVRQYCASFTYLRNTDRLPEDAIQYICCRMGPDCFRTLAYIPKTVLLAKENDLRLRHKDRTRQQMREQLLAGMQATTTIHELRAFLEQQDKSVHQIITGQEMDDATQSFVDRGYLVYYDRQRGKILEIMTPMDSSNQRKNLKTGGPADPMRYRTAPLWIYIEEL